MKKKRTLNQTWTLCLRMWRWIAKEWNKLPDDKRDIDSLKQSWLENKGFDVGNIKNLCFFCDYTQEEKAMEDCSLCPGSLIEPDFDCCDDGHYYRTEAPAFYKELLRLNKIRKG